MFDLFEELMLVNKTLREAGVEFAVCGGMAMAIHGFPRATVDLDILIRPESLDVAFEAVRPLGYIFKAFPMQFAKGSVEIRRVSKIDPRDGDTLMLDMLLVTPASEKVWETRQTAVLAEGVKIPVVSREGLIALKKGRSSGTDLDDIAKLRGER